jgi:phosphoribosylanthranilate isomerase
VIVQIYGVTTVDDARLVCDLGTDHLGVVPVSDDEDPWDAVEAEITDAILDTAAGRAARVVLSFATQCDDAIRTASRYSCEYLHLARAEAMPRAELAVLRESVTARLMLTVPVRDASAVEAARTLAPLADVLLLDTAHPRTGIVGASGHVHDWAVSARIVEELDVPVVLAGGLGPDNVGPAIEAVRPWGVDSETHTSRDDDRRRKDADRLARFVQRARAGLHP